MSKQNKISQFILTIILSIICIAVLVPLWMVISVSLTNEDYIVQNGYSFFIEQFDLSAYKYVFKNPTEIINAYKVTAIFSFAVMFLSVLLMSMIAYALSKSEFKWKRGISFYLYFTMLFHGGLAPSYILITEYLNLDDTIWVYIIPSLISPWYIFMMRSFFQGIPKEISESAIVDGASEYRIYFQMILPLSKPVLATVALFMFLGKWNDWNTSMLYINDESLISLQYLLQRIMQNIQLLQQGQGDLSGMLSASEIPSESVRMAMAVVVAGPALVIFPFFQKYFVKGLTVGSVKG